MLHLFKRWPRLQVQIQGLKKSMFELELLRSSTLPQVFKSCDFFSDLSRAPRSLVLAWITSFPPSWKRFVPKSTLAIYGNNFDFRKAGNFFIRFLIQNQSLGSKIVRSHFLKILFSSCLALFSLFPLIFWCSALTNWNFLWSSTILTRLVGKENKNAWLKSSNVLMFLNCGR